MSSVRLAEDSEILDAFEEFKAAIQSQDRAALEEFHDPDFQATELHGKLMTAEEHITAIMEGGELELEFFDLTVMGLGDLALGWGRQTLRGRLRPQDLTENLSAAIEEGIIFALTVVWRRSAGRWRVLTYHVSIIPDA